jgi:NAD(P)-dependent dehydrogenase (short-subunit alcohol dehydrogenase family)
MLVGRTLHLFVLVCRRVKVSEGYPRPIPGSRARFAWLDGRLMPATIEPVWSARPLESKVAIVTGSARGIGNAIGRRLSEAGAVVVLNDVRHEDQLGASIDEITAAGGSGTFVLADVSEPDGAKLLRDRVLHEFGRIDVLVNNAALVDAHESWGELSVSHWDEVFRVNLRSCYLMSRVCQESLAESGEGRIVNIGSITSFLGHTDLVHYSATKGGVVSFTRSLARELGPQHITVNTVVPGAIQTESEMEIFGSDLDEESIIRQQSVKRRGTARDVAGVVAFLASDEASFITGQAIVVDGGWVMH